MVSVHIVELYIDEKGFLFFVLALTIEINMYENLLLKLACEVIRDFYLQ